MQDLIIHEDDKFILPTKNTNNEAEMLQNAYIITFLTEIGKEPLFPEFGTNFKLASNTLDIRYINNQIINLLNPEYGLTEVEVLSYSVVADKVSIKVKLITNTLETTVTI